jgi:response regulator RpfG family c-di-GMP phosphodiesterase
MSMSDAEAGAMLRSGRGSQFDPAVVDCFLESPASARAIERTRA